MTLPAFKVEIDADPSTTTVFVLDRDVLDSGTHLLASTPRFVALPANDVLEVDIKRGRARGDQANDVGTATVTLDAWSGAYDPDNPASPYQFNGQRLLRQGMQMRVSATVSGVDYVMFTGALETTAAGYGVNPTMTWTCVDMLARLGHASFPPSADFIRGGESSEDRINWLLSYDPAYATRAVSPGGKTLVATQGGGTVLSQLESVARSEWGRVYADRDNVLTITHHADEFDKATVLTISDSGTDGGADAYVDIYADVYPGLVILPPDDLTVEPGLELVVNSAILTRPASTADAEDLTLAEAKFVGEDGNSVIRYGKRTEPYEILLADSTEAQALADYLATRRSNPAPWLTTVSTSLYGGSSTAWTSAAELELGDAVIVGRTTADGRELLWYVTAEGIDHSITPDLWKLTLSTAPLDLAALGSGGGWFTLDVDMLDFAALAPY